MGHWHTGMLGRAKVTTAALIYTGGRCIAYKHLTSVALGRQREQLKGRALSIHQASAPPRVRVQQPGSSV